MTLESQIRTEVADRNHSELRKWAAPTGGFSVWTVYVDELVMGMPLFRVYFVARDELSALRMPCETSCGECAWSSDGRYAALRARDLLCFWDTTAGRLAQHALKGAYAYTIRFDAGTTLRGVLDTASYKFSLMPRIVELDMSALDWRPTDPADRLSVGAAD